MCSPCELAVSLFYTTPMATYKDVFSCSRDWLICRLAVRRAGVTVNNRRESKKLVVFSDLPILEGSRLVGFIVMIIKYNIF